MKKLLGAILAGATALSLMACGKKNKLVIGTNAEFPPFEYKEGSVVTGFDMDLIKAYGAWANKEIEIQDMEFDAALAGVTTGKVDIAIAGITANDARREVMSFSNGYYSSNQVVVVNSESTTLTNLTTEAEILAALEGKTIGCQRGTTGQYYIEGDEDWEFPGIKNATATLFDNAPTALQALKNKQVEAVIIDEAPAKSIVSSKFSTTLTILPTALTSEEYAIAVKKDNKKLVDSLNEFLAYYKSNGEYDKLIKKYFDAE